MARSHIRALSAAAARPDGVGPLCLAARAPAVAHRWKFHGRNPWENPMEKCGTSWGHGKSLDFFGKKCDEWIFFLIFGDSFSRGFDCIWLNTSMITGCCSTEMRIVDIYHCDQNSFWKWGLRSLKYVDGYIWIICISSPIWTSGLVLDLFILGVHLWGVLDTY